MSLILLQITSFIYIILLAFFYFKKSRVPDVENKLYQVLLISNIVGLSVELLCFYGVANMDKFPFFAVLITKLLLVYYLFFIAIYTIYVIVISFKKEAELKVRKNNSLSRLSGMILIIFLLLSSIVSVLPMEYYFDGTYVYSYGTAVSFLQLVFILVMGLWGIILIKKYKDIKVKKYVPVIVFIVLAGIGGLIQSIYPFMLLTTPIETLIIFLMYFTIENPDMKLLEELHKAKEISDNVNEEKTLFLYNMTQEIRSITNDINMSADVILDSDNLEDDKECAREIKGITSKFNAMTNEILDVSKMDAANIKVYNSKYNIKLLIKEIVNLYEKKCLDKNIEFRTNIEHNIPDMLYGDSINLKEVLVTVLDNGIKYTNEGFVELDINTIIKNDICRLVITVEDSGNGIKSEAINNYKVVNGSLGKADKLVTLMNGTMMILSDYGKGTRVKIILDQKIENVSEEIVNKYNSFFENTKILVVDDSDASIKIIEKLLKDSNIIIDNCQTGIEALNKLKTKEHYDVILLDEELSKISGEELLKKMKNIRNFNIPVVLLSKDNKYEYSENYIEQGFSNVLIKPLKKEQLLNTINGLVDNEKKEHL